MRVTVSFVSDPQEDGVDTQTIYSHNNVEDLKALAWAFAEAARAGGYTYVDSVTFTTNSGNTFTGDF